ncbi:D-serine deaminase-like pyridoxal phosphate-dependent protein [Pedobacter sp. UYP30]|uniref:D-TA family PLP-dependent enzyme n=1 Tax=Pedobacter sp. UYP30 TaxID=1756400 RepID=UPI0033915A33
MENAAWYVLPNEADIETPSLIFYVDRIKENIRLLINMIDDKSRLRPHVKTHKCIEVTQLLLHAGIKKFKCATIAEAEMLGLSGADDVLLAYQPVGANILRFIKLIKQFPNTNFSCLVDDFKVAAQLAEQASAEDCIIQIYIDLNVGMNRTGVLVNEATALFKQLSKLKNLSMIGLHAYDGHIHDSEMRVRKEKSKPIIEILKNLSKELEEIGGRKLNIVAGGTPTFPIYAKETDFDCSPGTFVLWDKGYQDAYSEQPFLPAALVISRVISQPAKELICLDLGYKAVASEKPLLNRVFFLNAPELHVESQSEEHLVLSDTKSHSYKIGTVLYGLPYHICPTVALYEKAVILDADGNIQYWDIIARKRKITI